MTEKLMLFGEEWQPAVLEACEALHVAHTGAGDPLWREDEATLIGFLRDKLAKWHGPTSEYDTAVRSLCEAVLRERSVINPCAVNTESCAGNDDFGDHPPMVFCACGAFALDAEDSALVWIAHDRVVHGTDRCAAEAPWAPLAEGATRVRDTAVPAPAGLPLQAKS